MKSKSKKISITIAVILAVIVLGAFGVFYSESTVFSDLFSKNPEKEVQVLEAQYKINHKDKTLIFLCSALQDDSLYENKEYMEKLVTYGEMYLKSDVGKSDVSFHSQYLTALQALGMNEKFETECRAWFSNITTANELVWLCNALYSVNINGADSEKNFIEAFSKEVLESGKISSENKQEYDVLVSRFTELVKE